METRRDERISQLIQALKRSDKLHLKEAASLLGVSEMTIRRDLNGHSGPVVLLGGYIVLEPRSATHYLLSDQKTRLVEEKRPCRSPCGRAAGGPSDGLLRLRDHHAVDY
ncbi:Deoxyribose operon repressor [Klebsiella pneumoniae]|nr:Deoxyribose operon repressor [Klebsiella pneumoniae]